MLPSAIKYICLFSKSKNALYHKSQAACRELMQQAPYAALRISLFLPNKYLFPMGQDKHVLHHVIMSLIGFVRSQLGLRKFSEFGQLDRER